MSESLLHGAKLDVIIITKTRPDVVVGAVLVSCLPADTLRHSLPLQLSQPCSGSFQLDRFLFNLIKYFIKRKFPWDSIVLPLVLKAHSHPLVVKDYFVGLD